MAEANGNDVKMGDVMQKQGESVTWHVVGLEPDRIFLSGPGPCRGMALLMRSDIEKDGWERVSRRG